MSKLQQLKAYQPPKLDYLAQMKRNGGQPGRGSLISADASNLHNNPRLINKQVDRQSSINRNDPNRDSLQSRLIERIHSKKMNNKKPNRSESKKDDKSTERRVLQSEMKAQEEPIDEIGIQADDEDNDQIETERAHNPIQADLSKYHQVVAAAKQVPIQPYGYQELYQIKEEGGIGIQD